MPVYDSVASIIGKTPLLKLERFAAQRKAGANLFAKLEYLNPAGSTKDRVALSMILDAEEKGLLKPGATIIEPTSGNTGIALAALGVSRGYKVILTMPDTMSQERRDLLQAYGAQVVLTPGDRSMVGAIVEAKKLAAQIENSFIPFQFDNPANVKAHYETTGPEIWEALDGKIDVFVAGIGTGGTITGVGRYLKEKNPAIQVIGFEPAEAPFLTQGEGGLHPIQGIGANFVPSILDVIMLDDIIVVSSEFAFRSARDLAHTEGILVGILRRPLRRQR